METSKITGVIYGFIGLVVLFYVVAELYPTAAAAGDALNASGAPLGTLFVGGGVVFLIAMAGILLWVVKSNLKK